jgi:hypothetical protein
MAVKSRFLRRPDVAPLPEGAPVIAIAEWLAQFIEEEGHLTHRLAVVRIDDVFGDGFSYSEPVFDKHGKAKVGDRYLLHPDILLALKKLTGNNLIWGKDCREWWAKNARGRQAASARRDFRRSEAGCDQVANARKE